MARHAATPEKITFAEMRDMGVRDVLVFGADYHCGHSVALSADRWPDDLRLSDIEPRFVCAACGRRGAEVQINRPGDGLRPTGPWPKMAIVSPPCRLSRLSAPHAVPVPQEDGLPRRAI
jgi:hypothetical protein